MLCKGPLDLRINAFESAQRALSDALSETTRKRNFQKMECSVFLPPKIEKKVKTKEKVTKLRFDRIFEELLISPR